MLKTKSDILENLEGYYKYIEEKFTFIFIWLKVRLKHAWLLYIRNVSYLIFFLNFVGALVIWYLSVTNYKNNSQMFEIIFHM